MANPDQLGTVVVLPLARLTGEERVTRKRGRPRKVEHRPAVNEEAYNAAVCEARAKALAADPLVAAVSSGRIGAEVLHAAKVALAEETAALGALRRQQEAEGRDISQISSRRVDGLGKLAAVVLKLHKLGGDVVDPHGPRIQALWRHFVDTVADAARATLPAAEAGSLVTRLEAAARGWEDRMARP